MKISKKELRKIIKEALGIDTAVKAGQREIGNSSFQKAKEDAKKNGKSYFIEDDGEVIEFDKDGNANMKVDFNANDAFNSNDGSVHYKGSL